MHNTLDKIIMLKFQLSLAGIRPIVSKKLIFL